MRVYYNNGWVNICDDYSYSSTETNVICHQLGYTGASSYSRAGLVRLELCNKEALHHFCLGGTEHFMMDGMLLSRMLVSIVLLVNLESQLHQIIKKINNSKFCWICTNPQLIDEQVEHLQLSTFLTRKGCMILFCQMLLEKSKIGLINIVVSLLQSV